MGTTVIYNNVRLENVVTRDWEQEVRRDDSNTDVLYHTFRMRFEGLIHDGYHGDGHSVTSISLGQKSGMPEQYQYIHHALLTSRRPLYVLVSDSGGNEDLLFRCLQSPGDPLVGNEMDSRVVATMDRDVNNGPKPKSLRILQVIGAKCLRVAFEIECSKLICSNPVTSGSNVMPPVLNNRWSVEEGMDENQFITRTISGRMRLSAAVGETWVARKHLVVPSLEMGFRRAAINYSVTPDGLTCEYRVIDRQVHTAAPWPATKMDARYTQATNDGLTMTAEVYVGLEGSPAADKKALFARAMQVIDAKLNFNAMLKDDGKGYLTQYLPEHVSFTEYMGDANRVEATARFLITPAEGSLQEYFAVMRKELGEPLKLKGNYNPAFSTAPAIYGYNPPVGDNTVGTYRSSAVFFMLQCYLQQPCFDVHGIGKFGYSVSPPASTESQDSGTTTPQPSDSTGGTELNQVPDGTISYNPGENNWSPKAKASAYTFSAVSNRYETTQNIVQLPVAGVPGTASAAQAVATAQAASNPDAVRSAEQSQVDSGPTQQSYDTCKMFRLAGPSCRRIIDMDVERAGELPDVAMPLSSFSDGINGSLRGTLVKNWMDSHPPCLSADGVTLVYRISIHYIYAMNRAPYIGESYRLGVAPQTKFKRTDKQVQFEPSKAYGNHELDP